MARTFQQLYQYAQRRLSNKSSTQAVAVAKDVVNFAVRYLAEQDYAFYRKRGVFNALASFSSGTLSVDDGASFASLTSGGAWSSNYSGGMLRIDDSKIHLEVSITSVATRLTFASGVTWGYDGETDVGYQLYKYEYPLPSDFRAIGDALEETILGRVTWMDNINDFEAYRLQNYSNIGPFEYACIKDDNIMLWPPYDERQMVPLPYKRWPADMTADADEVDFPDKGGGLLLLHAAIDYYAAIEEGDNGDMQNAKSRLNTQEDRTRASVARGRDSLLEMGSVGAAPYHVTKIVGSDDSG